MSDIVDAARAMRAAINAAGSILDDTQAYACAAMFPQWQSAAHGYAAGDRVTYNSKLYKCLQPHTSQGDWSPDVAVSLWVEISDPQVEWPTWVQPTGAHDAYAKNSKVTHNGERFKSLIDANVWEPGASGSETLWEGVSA